MAREGGTGTFCWEHRKGGLCADAFGPISNVTPIAILPGMTLEFVFDAGVPRDTSFQWFTTEDLDSREEGGIRAWGPKAGTSPTWPPYTEVRTAPTEPGLYVLSVFTLFPEGDVTYGFYVEVR